MVLREEVRVAETYVRVVQDRYEDKETVVRCEVQRSDGQAGG